MPSQEEQERFIQLVENGEYQKISEELLKKPSLIKSRDKPDSPGYGKETTTQFCLCILILYFCKFKYNDTCSNNTNNIFLAMVRIINFFAEPPEKMLCLYL